MAGCPQIHLSTAGQRRSSHPSHILLDFRGRCRYLQPRSKKVSSFCIILIDNNRDPSLQIPTSYSSGTDLFNSVGGGVIADIPSNPAGTSHPLPTHLSTDSLLSPRSEPPVPNQSLVQFGNDQSSTLKVQRRDDSAKLNLDVQRSRDCAAFPPVIPARQRAALPSIPTRQRYFSTTSCVALFHSSACSSTRSIHTVRKHGASINTAPLKSAWVGGTHVNK